MEFITAEKILSVCDLLDIVTSTMGPNGKLVSITEMDEVLRLTKDGVSVLNSLHIHDDYVKSAILNFIKEAARRTDEIVGDNTTTTTCMVVDMLRCALQKLRIQDISPQIVESIRKWSDYYIQKLKEVAINNVDADILKNIIYTSTNNDEQLTDIIYKAFEVSNFQNSIVINDTDDKVLKTELNVIKEGMYFNSIAHVFQETECKDHRLVLVSGKINSITLLEPIIREAYKENVGLIIIASDFHETVQRDLKANRDRKKVFAYAVRAEGFNDEEYTITDAVSKLTGSKIFTTVSTNSEYIQKAELKDCALVDATVSRSGSIIKPHKYSKIVAGSLINKYKDDNSDLAKFIIAKVLPTATITVGAPTTARRNEIKDRIQDAVYATESVLKDGCIIGGGYTPVKLIDDENEDADSVSLSKEIVLRAMTSVFINLRLLESADIKFHEDFMYDFKKHEDVSIKDTKNLVYDPARGMIEALKNATEVVCTILSIKGFIDASPSNY